MRKSILYFHGGALALAAGVALGAAAAGQAGKRPGGQTGIAASQAAASRPAEVEYGVVRTLAVAGGGKWDPWSSSPVTLDDAGKLLYVSREPRTQVIDVATGKVVAEIDSGPRAQPGAVALVPKAGGEGRGFVINHTGNCVTVFDLKTFAVLGTVAVNGEPRGIVYDPMSKRVLVGCGIPAALVPIDPDIDLKTGKADVAIDLQGTPTGMVCDGEGMCYVNINDRDEVAVIDTREMRQVTSWPVQAWYRPEGLALDPERNRLFVGCRAHVVVLSAVDGHTLADLVVTGPNASVAQGAVQFYDGKAFTSCGHGLMVVVGQSRTGAFEVEQRAQVPGNAWPFAVDRRTGTFYMPASDVNAGRRWPGDTGIKVAVIAGK